MTIFSKMIEDPFYDDEGVLDDADWEDSEDTGVAEKPHQEDLSPYETINS